MALSFFISLISRSSKKTMWQSTARKTREFSPMPDALWTGLLASTGWDLRVGNPKNASTASTLPTQGRIRPGPGFLSRRRLSQVQGMWTTSKKRIVRGLSTMITLLKAQKSSEAAVNSKSSFQTSWTAQMTADQIAQRLKILQRVANKELSKAANTRQPFGLPKKLTGVPLTKFLPMGLGRGRNVVFKGQRASPTTSTSVRIRRERKECARTTAKGSTPTRSLSEALQQ